MYTYIHSVKNAEVSKRQILSDIYDYLTVFIRLKSKKQKRQQNKNIKQI